VTLSPVANVTGVWAELAPAYDVWVRPSPGTADQRSTLVDIRIGVIHTAKEIEVELADDSDRDKLMDDIDSTLGRPDSVLWLTDRRGRRVGVPVSRVAYVEMGAASEDRRVGFGAP
jgi:hypothetical protein